MIRFYGAMTQLKVQSSQLASFKISELISVALVGTGKLKKLYWQ